MSSLTKVTKYAINSIASLAVVVHETSPGEQVLLICRIPSCEHNQCHVISPQHAYHVPREYAKTSKVFNATFVINGIIIFVLH